MSSVASDEENEHLKQLQELTAPLDGHDQDDTLAIPPTTDDNITSTPPQDGNAKASERRKKDHTLNPIVEEDQEMPHDEPEMSEGVAVENYQAEKKVEKPVEDDGTCLSMYSLLTRK